jgi:chromosome segregation ATPase
MKQPDTAALRERLANYTPEEELKQDIQELEGLFQELGCQIVELRNLLKEIHALKEELHDIHGSLKHTVQRERTAFKALEAAKESADNIVDGISNAIVKVEKNTVIQAKVDNRELAKVNQCSADHIKAEKKLLEEHSKELAKHLLNNEGIWLSSGWFKIWIITQFIFCVAVSLWAILDR